MVWGCLGNLTPKGDDQVDSSSTTSPETSCVFFGGWVARKMGMADGLLDFHDNMFRNYEAPIGPGP